MIEHILVAVDGSEHADRAVDLAAEIAGAFEAELTVLNVVSHSSLVPMAMGAYAELEHVYLASRDVLEGAGNEIVDNAEERARLAGIEKITKIIEFGSPAQTICEAANARDIDVIVMGRRGLGDFGGLLLGSVTHKVSHVADATVVTVK